MTAIKIKSLVPYLIEPDDYLFITSRLNQPLHVMGLNWDYEGNITIITVYRDDTDNHSVITLFVGANQLDYEFVEAPQRYALYGGSRRNGKILAIRDVLKKYPGNILHIKRGEEPMLELHIKCKFCDRDYTLLMPAEAYVAYAHGAATQDALPMLSLGERELLISGICEDCFNALTSEGTNK